MPGYAKNLLLVIASTALTVMLVLLAARGVAMHVGADLANEYEFEPRPILWAPDPDLGYTNRPNVRHDSFANVVANTNAQGFRSDRPTPLRKPPETVRIFGIGDSVMWGTRVQANESIIGRLEDEYRAHGVAAEAIDAGVVGYSTYQERLFFEKYVVPYAPDIVVVNFCSNDAIPSEDPFDTGKAPYMRYAESLLAEDTTSAPERAALSRLLATLEESNGWLPVLALWKSTEHRAALKTILIERPIREMYAIAGQHGIRLVYVIVTPTRLDTEVAAFLRTQSFDYVDVSKSVTLDVAGAANARQPPPRESGTGPLDRGIFKPIGDLQKWMAFNRIQRERNFIDHWGHPSAKGNKAIAALLYEHLAARQDGA